MVKDIESTEEKSTAFVAPGFNLQFIYSYAVHLHSFARNTTYTSLQRLLVWCKVASTLSTSIKLFAKPFKIVAKTGGKVYKTTQFEVHLAERTRSRSSTSHSPAGTPRSRYINKRSTTRRITPLEVPVEELMSQALPIGKSCFSHAVT